jgi:hypothetical protein
MMRNGFDRRVVILALLATFLLWALSLGSGAVASPYRANQTIPTFTPTGQASPTPQPTTPGPTPPQVTPGGSVSPPTVTLTPSATATLRPGETAPAATATQIPSATEPAEASPTPPGATMLPASSTADTPGPGEPAGGPTAAAEEPSSAPFISGSPTPGGELPSLPTSSPAGETSGTEEAGSAAGGQRAAGSMLFSPPCMWLFLGLILMVTGAALLLGRRRRGQPRP